MATRRTTQRGKSTRHLVTVTGIDDVIRDLKAVSDNVQADLEDALHAGAKVVEEDAKRRAPVANDAHHGKPPGNLRREIMHDIHLEGYNKPVARIGPSKDAWYGLFPEVGTRHSAATPYLRPALDENRDKIERAIAESLDNAIKAAL